MTYDAVFVEIEGMVLEKPDDFFLTNALLISKTSKLRTSSGCPCSGVFATLERGSDLSSYESELARSRQGKYLEALLD